MSNGQAVQLVTMNNDGSTHVAMWFVSQRHVELLRAAYTWLFGAPVESLADANAIAQLREVTDGFLMMNEDPVD